MAALAGVQAAVHLHIRCGDDVNATDDKGRSPLILAASRGHTETCRILLEAGADPRAVDKVGNDALSIAMGTGKTELASLLREHLYPPPKSPCEEQQENEHLVGLIPVDDASRTAQVRLPGYPRFQSRASPGASTVEGTGYFRST